MPYLFDIWGMPDHQMPPEGEWNTWLILGGRGAGKTRAGTEWIRSQLEGPRSHDPGKRQSAALVAATLDEARDIMVLGRSGLIACSPPDRKPKWNETRRTLNFPNGAVATCFSASSPEKLRGPEFDCAWADEVGKWPDAREAWDMLQMCLRLGDHPQLVATTTPRAIELLEDLVVDRRIIISTAPTSANQANLGAGFLERVTQQYAGSSRGQQELEGEMLIDREGALWTRSLIDAARVRSGPEMERIVVSVDPPVSTGSKADECGIIVAGIGGKPRCAYVLADRSSQGESPQSWAERVIRTYHEFKADRVVAEVNQGGDLVRSLIHEIDPSVSFKAVFATRGKSVRAEPVSALYERGRVKHLGGFPILEAQMRVFGSDDMKGSPDRVDALVWAMTELMLGDPGGRPRVRTF